MNFVSNVYFILHTNNFNRDITVLFVFSSKNLSKLKKSINESWFSASVKYSVESCNSRNVLQFLLRLQLQIHEPRGITRHACNIRSCPYIWRWFLHLFSFAYVHVRSSFDVSMPAEVARGRFRSKRLGQLLVIQDNSYSVRLFWDFKYVQFCMYIIMTLIFQLLKSKFIKKIIEIIFKDQS